MINWLTDNIKTIIMKRNKQILNILLLSTFFIYSCSTEHREYNDAELLGFKGKVKSVKVSNYEGDINFSTVVKGKLIDESVEGRTNYFVTFNEDGFITKRTYFDDNNDIKREVYFEHNLFNNLSEINKYKRNGILDERSVYSYNLIQKLVMVTTYNSKGDFISKTKYKYYLNGNNKLEEYYGDSYHTYTKYEYSNNKLTEKNHYINSLDKLDLKSVYEYDIYGKLISKHNYPLDGNPNWYDVYKYNNKGKRIEDSYYSDGELVSKWTLDYDSKGNIIEANLFFHHRHDSKIEYKGYDWENNWTKSIRYYYGYNTEPLIFIKERKFEYYD